MASGQMMGRPGGDPESGLPTNDVGAAVLLAAEARGQGLRGLYPMAVQVLAEELFKMRGKLELALSAKNELETELLHATQEADELRASLKAVVSHWREFGPDHGFDECIERAAGRRGLDA